ncbi:MAG: Hsp20/alpha crystallin family protein [Candidatus Bathyarchaeota archaeon]|nr:Hsp20/alpha crystallin family protein [Candidatus Bathyarchaeota archaeon]
MSEDEKKKKYYYYYGGKEKKAGEIKKAEPEGELYPFQRDFDNMMQRFQRAFDDFWVTPPARWGHGFRHHHVFPPMMLPSVDLEDQGKDYRLTVDLPGFSKEDVDVEVTEDAVTIQAKKTMSEEEKKKNYVRQERSSQAYYRRVPLPEMVVSDDAKACVNNGILEVTLPKKEPKKSKKLAIT